MAELKLDLSRVDQVVMANNAAEGQGEEGVEDGGIMADMDPLNDMYENLPPIEKLERYFQSEDILDREVAVRCIVYAVEAATLYSEYQLILEISMTLANDHEPTIRMSILDTVGLLLDHHTRLCDSVDSENGIENKERLFDVPIRMVTDINQQVRRMSQNCIISLLEAQTKDKDVLIGQLLPEMVRCLRRDEQYDLRMDMALLLSRLAPLLGRNILLRHFVPLLPSLSHDAMFHVRKAFAISCRDLAPVLGEDLTEEHILKPFLVLCHDDVWGVRKACADVFSDISNCCNLGTRHDRLTPCFLRLLQDESRWVRRTAFEHLGSFIATFYVPSDTPDPFSCDDESSLDPFGDSVLLDNSLISSSDNHEEDGVWVGGPEPKEEDNNERAPSPDEHEDSNTAESDIGTGMERKSKANEGEELFFYFMHTSVSSSEGTPPRGEKCEGTNETRKSVTDDEVVSRDEDREKKKEGMLELCVIGGVQDNESDAAAKSIESSDADCPGSEPSERLALDVREGALNGNDGCALNVVNKCASIGIVESTTKTKKTEVSENWRCSEKEEEQQNKLSQVQTVENQDDREGGLLLEQSQECSSVQSNVLSEEDRGRKGDKSDNQTLSKAKNIVSDTRQELTQLSTQEEQTQNTEVTVEPAVERKEKEGVSVLENEVSNTGNEVSNTGNEEEQGVYGEGGDGELVKDLELSNESQSLEQKGEVDSSTTPGQEAEVDSGTTLGQEAEVDTGTTLGQKREVETGTTPGQEGEIETCTTPGQEGEVDTGTTPGQEGEVDTGTTPGQEGEVDTGTTQGQEIINSDGGESKKKLKACETPHVMQNFPPVRVLVHTTAGQVMEPTCDHGDDAGLNDDGDYITTARHRAGYHDNVVSMDLTLATNSDTNPNMDITIDPFGEEALSQEIVPDELMDLYLSMTDATKSQTVDSDLPYYCAFCFPGVMLTLGAENWPLLRTTFLTLSGDLQWKIRRVLAYSLHELARILGPETTIADLFPTFEEYCTKDVDDVKIGALSHLAEFFEFLPISLRHSCLPTILEGLLEVENPKNWRYRHTLVEQLVTMCDFYDADYLHTHIYPIAKQLMDDKVSQVRHSATQLLAMILHRLTQITPDGYLPLLREMKTEYANHPCWNFRQLFVSQCKTFLSEMCISQDVFVAECLPSLLSLVNDKVPNVRLALAKTIRDTLLIRESFEQSTVDQMQSVLTTLQTDTDRDVAYFAGGDISSYVRPHPGGGRVSEVRYRSQSQASEEQYHDAVDTLEGGNAVNEHEAWLQSWEEALSGPTLQMTGEIR